MIKIDLQSLFFTFHANKIFTSYVLKKSKNVLLVSPMHYNDKIEENTSDNKKLDFLTFHNFTKSGVNVVNMMVTSCNVARHTRRWSLVVFSTCST